MNDTAAEPANFAVIDDTGVPEYAVLMDDDTGAPEYDTVIGDTAEPDYLAVMNDTGAPEYDTVIGDTAESNYLAVMTDTGAPEYDTVICDTAEPDYLAVMDDTGAPNYLALTDDTGTPEYAAAIDDAAHNPTYHETAEDTSVSTRTDDNTVYSELDATQVYEDIVDIVLSSNTDTQSQVVAEPPIRSRYACKKPQLILAATVIVVVLIALVVFYSLVHAGILKLTENTTNDNAPNNKFIKLGRVKSAKQMYNFTFVPLAKYESAILSVSSNGHLLVGSLMTTNMLHIYTIEGSHVKILNVPYGVAVYDALWTLHGNIVCTTEDYVVLLSVTGEILANSTDGAGRYLSVSQDGDIYISKDSNVLESTDEGMTWTVKFSTLDNMNYVHQAIKVSSDQYSDIFWTVESKSPDISVKSNTQLRMYTLNKAADNADRSVSRSSVTHLQNDVNYCSLTFDGHSTMFFLIFNNNNVLMWSVNGTFNGQLHLPPDNDSVDALAIDSAYRTMYVGDVHKDLVSVFALTYESP